MSPLPAPTPVITPETERFWAATAEGTLLLPRCTSCAEFFWYPRSQCPGCLSPDLEWIPASGAGTVYSYTACTRGAGEYAGVPVYILAYVELAEGPTIMTNLVECEPSEVSIGMPVSLVFHDTGAGSALPRFRPPTR